MQLPQEQLLEETKKFWKKKKLETKDAGRPQDVGNLLPTIGFAYFS